MPPDEAVAGAMSAPASLPLPAVAVEGGGEISWLAPLRRVENTFAAGALGLMAALPVLEIVLRALFHVGVPGSVPLVQNLVLAVSMLGGALAARENRLLALSAATPWLKGHWKLGARVISSGIAAAISAVLCGASWQFVANSRILGKMLIRGVPVWAVQSLLFIGFGAIAIRLIWHVGSTWAPRVVALALAVGLLVFATQTTIDPAELRWPAMAILLLGMICGAPIFTALGGAALILLWSGGEPVSPVPLKHYQLTVNPTLPSIPLFTLAGYFMAEGAAATRLVQLFNAFFGGFRGGPAIVTALVCAFFTSFTGASGATILALGGVLMPVLLAARYSEKTTMGLLTGAGSLGMLFPPCLPPILYAIIASSGGQANVSIADMFKGGLLPGLLLVAMTAVWGVRNGPKTGRTELTRFDPKAARQALWAAKWELLVPVVALAALFGGFATPVEAAAMTAFYTFFVGTFVHRELNLFRDVPRVLIECSLLMGGVLLILGVALGFTHYLIDAEIPDRAVAWAIATIQSKWIFLLGLNFVLIIVGGLVEIYAAIVVAVPLLVPLGTAFGIDPIHLGIIFLANMELGFLAPPVGLNLLLASYRFNKPLSTVIRASLPMLAVMAIGLLLITYLPWLTTWLPSVWK